MRQFVEIGKTLEEAVLNDRVINSLDCSELCVKVFRLMSGSVGKIYGEIIKKTAKKALPLGVKAAEKVLPLGVKAAGKVLPLGVKAAEKVLPLGVKAAGKVLQSEIKSTSFMTIVNKVNKRQFISTAGRGSKVALVGRFAQKYGPKAAIALEICQGAIQVIRGWKAPTWKPIVDGSVGTLASIYCGIQGAEIGTMICPFFGIGTVVGGIIGSYFGSELVGYFSGKLF